MDVSSSFVGVDDWNNETRREWTITCLSSILCEDSRKRDRELTSASAEVLNRNVVDDQVELMVMFVGVGGPNNE
jgi:hypothetical protein